MTLFTLSMAGLLLIFVNRAVAFAPGWTINIRREPRTTTFLSDAGSSAATVGKLKKDIIASISKLGDGEVLGLSMSIPMAILIGGDMALLALAIQYLTLVSLVEQPLLSPVDWNLRDALSSFSTRASDGSLFDTSSLFLDPDQLSLQKILKELRGQVGTQVALAGAIGGSADSIIANPKVLWTLLQLFKDIYAYMEETDILDEEVKLVLNWRLADNMALLGKIQQEDLGHQDGVKSDRRDEFLEDELTPEQLNAAFPFREAQRFVKYAISAYGDAVIGSADVESYGKLDSRLGEWTKERIAQHVDVPEEDFLAFDAEYTGDTDMLRHFIAVDHKHRKIILAIRGTFSLHEVAIDLNGFSRPFLDGESHAAISLLSERLYDKVSSILLQALEDNEDYELIVTGHSLGGGATLCVNLLLHEDERFHDKKFRAFSFAAPPVYTPLSKAENSLKTAVNYIHQYDEVPFLSGDSIRHLLACLAVMDDFTSSLSLPERANLLLGLEKLPDDLISRVMTVQREPLAAEKSGMPAMALPVLTNVWLWKQEDDGIGGEDSTYDVKLCNSQKLTSSGIHVHKDQTKDHLMAKYEYSMMNLDPRYL